MAEMAATGSRARLIVALLVGGGVLLVLIANAHLVYVATVSQPECVPHVRQGEGAAAPGQYSAAQSACSPPQVDTDKKQAQRERP